MDPGMILFIGVAIGLVLLFGYANYKAAVNRGKKLYCEVNCKEEETCDFLESDKNKRINQNY